MTPLLVAGAASVAGELVSRLAGAVNSSGKSAVPSSGARGRGFDHALFQAAGKGLEQRQLEELRERVLQIPEVSQALSSQPVGAVTAAEVRADGSVAISTTRGPLEIAVSAESRALLQQAYRSMAAMGAPGSAPVGALGSLGSAPIGAALSGMVSSLSSAPAARIPGIWIPVRSV
jgi:hypothetical protein